MDNEGRYGEIARSVAIKALMRVTPDEVQAEVALSLSIGQMVKVQDRLTELMHLIDEIGSGRIEVQHH